MNIDLKDLSKGQFGLSKAKADQLSEAASCCFAKHSHPNPAALKVTGSWQQDCTVKYRTASKRAQKANADPQEAVEDGAMAIAIAAVTGLTDYCVVERSVKKTGVDWWLGREDGVFEARLEISGILNGPQYIDSRTTSKLGQMRQSDSTGLPGFAAIVEFSGPEARIQQK